MRVSLRLGLILTIAAILLSTLLIGGVLTYWHAGRKLDVEMKSALSTVERTVRITLHDIDRLTTDSPQIRRLIHTFDQNRHVRVDLADGNGETLIESVPLSSGTGMPDWFYRFLAPRFEPITVPLSMDGPNAGLIRIHADPANEAAELWGDIRLHLTTLLLFCLLVLAFLYGLLTHALSPLRDLLSGFERIGKGQFRDEIPIRGPRDLELLARGFNRMSGLLQDMQEKNGKLASQLDAVQDEERASLARDLHDEIGPLLFSADVDATAIRELAVQRGDDGRIVERAEALKDALGQIRDQVRTLLWQLRPGLLLDLGLRNALENLVSVLRTRHPQIAFDLEISAPGWPVNLEPTILAIVREAMNNALKHGNPSRIAIAITAQGDNLETRIEDDGTGLPANPERGGLGVISMSERARIAGGLLSLRTGSDRRGVTVSLSLPLAAPGQISNRYTTSAPDLQENGSRP